MPSYKLYYFNNRGLGEVIRLAFAVAGVDYEDIRYTNEEWQTHKADMPLHIMPVLEIDGKKFCQSAAISRMIAREYGLYGVSVTEAFRIDELYEAIGDAIKEMAKPFYEKDEEKKAELSKNLWEVVFPKFLNFFEMRLGENGEKSGFLVGDKLSIADLALFNVLDVAEEMHGSPLLGNNPKLQALIEHVKAVPEIAAWVEKRPVTDH